MNPEQYAKIEALKSSRDDCCVTRELTVGELLDRHITKSTRMLNALSDLKNSLPASFLNSGASRLAGVLEL